MSSAPVIRYAVPCGIAPEREEAIERTFLSSPWARARSYLLSREAARVVKLAGACEGTLRDASDAALSERLAAIVPSLRSRSAGIAESAEALGIVREVASRRLGQRPFDEQLFAAFVLQRAGLAEMATGEGKTLTAGLAAAISAISGVPVHVLSSNDFLVERDADAMRPLYEGLGLRAARVVAREAALEDRAAAYRADVLYLTPRELAFDYLRDRRILGGAGPLSRRVARIAGRLDGGMRQRGLHFAIVDEADDVLLDQACTPFVLSQKTPDAGSSARAGAALDLARECVAGRDLVCGAENEAQRLTDAGAAYLTSRSDRDDLWSQPRERQEWVEMALVALTGLALDTDYIVREGRIEIVDRPTGRRLPNQHYERGLQQILESKEGLEASAATTGTARIAGQALFRRYRKLSAMTGTAAESRPELWRVYGLPVVRIPLRRPSRRIRRDFRCYGDPQARDEQLATSVEEVSGSGRPVLVGTGSVEESRRIAELLAERGVVGQVLNAADDAEEAAIVSSAGVASCVTVATNMAGRGVDIALGPGVAEKGGLHIICTRVSESRRVDRQLVGRCARQGDPGSFETLLSLSDPFFVEHLPAFALDWARARAAETGRLSPRITQMLRWAAQTAEERRAEVARRALLDVQSGRDQLLAFAGKSE